MRLVVLTLAITLVLTGSISCGNSRDDHGPPALAEAPANGVKDPVCGMIVDPKTAAAKADYKGKTYYFCSREDKDRFEKSPAQFLADAR